MKRYYIMLALFTLCLVVAGCRRGGGGVPRKPVFVEFERDIIPAKNEHERVFAVRPADRKYRIWLENVYEVDAEIEKQDKGVQKKRWADIVRIQEEMEKDKTDADAATKLQEYLAKADKQEAAAEFKEFSRLSLKFLTMKQATPKHISQEEFYKWVRRENFVFNRKLLDKVDMEIFHEVMRLIKYIEQGSMVFVPDVDMDPRAKDYIIAHREESGGGGGGMMMMGGGGGGGGKLYYVNTKDVGITSGSGATLTSLLKEQDLRLLRMHYLTFAGSHFMRPPATPQEIALWNFRDATTLPLQPYENYMKRIPYEIPWQIYRQVEDRIPAVMKNPPDPRDMTKFKVYLKDKAPPSVLSNIEDGITWVNNDSSLRYSAPNPGQNPEKFDTVQLKGGGAITVLRQVAPDTTNSIVACRGQIEEFEMMAGGKYPAQLAIHADGQIGYALPNVVAPFRPVIIPKKDPGMMMGMPK